jgi:two-component system alkaline phosphatase synthesis response regulator PhoP
VACRVLVADDDELVLQLLEHKLANRGYVVSKASDGESTLAIAQQLHPDLIVLDVMMPGLDGIEVLRRLQKDPATRNIPVVILSARKQEEDIVTALRLGARDYIVKPFMPEELLARIDRILVTSGPH